MALEPLNAGHPQTATGRILVGTSGWSYRHWRGSFYPERLAGNATLAYYAARFATVEVNRTFYSLPEAATIERWRETAPAGLHVRGQGAAADHPHEAPAAQRGHPGRLRQPRARPGRRARPDPVPASRRLSARHRPAAQLPRHAAARPLLRLRVSRRELVSRPHLRPAGRPRGRLLHLPPGRSRDAARGDGAVRLPAPARARARPTPAPTAATSCSAGPTPAARGRPTSSTCASTSTTTSAGRRCATP